MAIADTILTAAVALQALQFSSSGNFGSDWPTKSVGEALLVSCKSSYSPSTPCEIGSDEYTSNEVGLLSVSYPNLTAEEVNPIGRQPQSVRNQEVTYHDQAPLPCQSTAERIIGSDPLEQPELPFPYPRSIPLSFPFGSRSDPRVLPEPGTPPRGSWPHSPLYSFGHSPSLSRSSFNSVQNSEAERHTMTGRKQSPCEGNIERRLTDPVLTTGRYLSFSEKNTLPYGDRPRAASSSSSISYHSPLDQEFSRPVLQPFSQGEVIRYPYIPGQWPSLATTSYSRTSNFKDIPTSLAVSSSASALLSLSASSPVASSSISSSSVASSSTSSALLTLDTTISREDDMGRAKNVDTQLSNQHNQPVAQHGFSISEPNIDIIQQTFVKKRGVSRKLSSKISPNSSTSHGDNTFQKSMKFNAKKADKVHKGAKTTRSTAKAGSVSSSSSPHGSAHSSSPRIRLAQKRRVRNTTISTQKHKVDGDGAGPQQGRPFTDSMRVHLIMVSRPEDVFFSCMNSSFPTVSHLVEFTSKDKLLVNEPQGYSRDIEQHERGQLSSRKSVWHFDNNNIAKSIRQLYNVNDFYFVKVIRPSTNQDHRINRQIRSMPMLKMVAIPLVADTDLTCRYLKQEVAHPRYKSDMKYYIVPGTLTQETWYYTSNELYLQEHQDTKCHQLIESRDIIVNAPTHEMVATMQRRLSMAKNSQ
jgi:hypothetical protein